MISCFAGIGMYGYCMYQDCSQCPICDFSMIENFIQWKQRNKFSLCVCLCDTCRVFCGCIVWHLYAPGLVFRHGILKSHCFASMQYRQVIRYHLSFLCPIISILFYLRHLWRFLASFWLFAMPSITFWLTTGRGRTPGIRTYIHRNTQIRKIEC